MFDAVEKIRRLFIKHKGSKHSDSLRSIKFIINNQENNSLFAISRAFTLFSLLSNIVKINIIIEEEEFVLLPQKILDQVL